MAMALGVTASAYAANPFSDVPAGHWAYDSISKLAAAGVIEGYPDGTFGGDKLMTRYEMAQIVAKAMAKGANVDRLAAEFADELDNLGVRVAALEKKADNVKIAGELRYDYLETEGATYQTGLRSRLWINGRINDDWSYTGMLENTQDLKDNSGNEDTEFKRAYLEGRLGGLDVVAGRYNETTASGNILDVDLDGVKVSYGKDVKVFGVAGKAADGVTIEDKSRVYIAGAEAAFGAVDAYANYFKADNDYKQEIYNVGVGFDIAKDLNLSYEYMWGAKKYDDRVSKDGYVVGLSYKEADPAEAGTWGIHARYYDQPANAFLAPTHDGDVFDKDGGYKGWNAGIDVTLAKNIQYSFNYYDTEAKAEDLDSKVLYNELYFFF